MDSCTESVLIAPETGLESGMNQGAAIAPLTADDVPELSDFLIEGFGVARDCEYFSHGALRWK